MGVALWSTAMVVGFGLSVLAGSRAVTHPAAFARVTDLPPIVVGITLPAIGTDLPEIANSIVASASDHGDIDVGDFVGSAATQVTLAIGLLPFIGAVVITSGRRPYATGLFAAAAVTLMLMAISRHGRSTGAVALGLYGLFSVVLT